MTPKGTTTARMIEQNLILILILLPFAGAIAAATISVNARNAAATLAALVMLAGLAILAVLYPPIGEGQTLRAYAFDTYRTPEKDAPAPNRAATFQVRDVAAVEAPFVLASTTPLALSLADIGLVSHDTEATCPVKR